MTRRRSLGFAAIALLAAAATTLLCFGDALELVPSTRGALSDAALAAPRPGQPPEPLDILQAAPAWIDAAPRNGSALRGKVVVVNFWTYSCINSLRALPYLRAWQQRYGDKGLVLVGVHAPEFGFEKDPQKVKLANDDLGIHYPVVQDNDYSIWRQFGNEGWPGFYYVDATGKVRGYHLGEGRYAEGEQLIRRLLTEAGQDLADVPVAPVESAGIEAQADWSDLQSPEAYIGYAKAIEFMSPGGIRRDTVHDYAAAAGLSRNQWDLAGQWALNREYATLKGASGKIRFRFHARDLHLVLGGPVDRQPVRFRVTIDGAEPGADHGVDVDAHGWGIVRKDRLYQLVRQTGAIADRTVTVEFMGPGVRAYVFTFG